MPIDTMQPRSPGWWLKRLMAGLDADRPRYNRLESYFRCENGIPVHADKAVRQAYQRLMSISRNNFAELVVEAVRERMKPVGIRTSADSDDLGDSEAWRIWQANSLDADSMLVDRAALTMSKAYVMVGGVDPEIAAPVITIEDPREVYAETDPRRRRRVLGAVKVWCDDVDGKTKATMIVRGDQLAPAIAGVYVFHATSTAAEATIDPTGWEWDELAVERLPVDVVPVVPFVNRADAMGRGLGEFESNIPTLDRIAYSTLNRIEIATLQAFRQRAIKGVPDRDENGAEIDYDDIFAADPGAFWVLPASADVWESGVVDLNPLRAAIRDDIQDLAAATRTPLFYLTPDSANGSAEGASLAREGLVFKVGDRIVQASESWEQVMSIAFSIMGDPVRANRSDMEMLWAPPDRVSLAEKYMSATQAKAAGLSQRAILSDVLGFTPQQIAREEADAAAQALLTPVAV